MFEAFLNDVVVLVKKDGTRYENIRASVEPKSILIPDASLPIEEGDRILRILPNKLQETYIVLDRGFQSEFGGIAAHYDAKVQKETKLTKPSLGTTIYNVHGAHARININSQDSSINIVNVNTKELFSTIRDTIKSTVSDTIRSKALLECVDTLESTQGKSGFIQAYQNFIQTAANHITIIAPFLPALTQLLSK